MWGIFENIMWNIVNPTQHCYGSCALWLVINSKMYSLDVMQVRSGSQSHIQGHSRLKVQDLTQASYKDGDAWGPSNERLGLAIASQHCRSTWPKDDDKAIKSRRKG